MALSIIVERSKRGVADASRQLSSLQRRVLVWLLERTFQNEQAALGFCISGNLDVAVDADDRKALERTKKRVKDEAQKGILWRAKHFYEDTPTRSQEASLSKALHRLESRGLVSLYDAAGGVGRKRRTIHVKLTKAGADEARRLKRHNGMSTREFAKHCRVEEARKLAALKQELAAVLTAPLLVQLPAFVSRELAAPFEDIEKKARKNTIRRLEAEIETLEYLYGSAT